MVDGIDKVVAKDICVGCGACAFAQGGSMTLDHYGFFKPPADLVSDSDALARICPFTAPDLNEDVLADRLLPESPSRDHKLGKYHDIFAAHVEEADFRPSGSSGGLGSWIASELLERKIVDGVIHARPVERTGAETPFFRYEISRSVEDVRAAAHSHYHVVEMSQVLAEVKRRPGKYLFIGISCMVKALRRVQLADPIIADRVIFAMGLVCGHLKSVHWALSLGWAAGVRPENMDSIVFRVKSENVLAKAYYFQVKDRTKSDALTADSAPLTGGKFNLGAMMPEACNYCDDVLAETADLTIGDAWLPRYSFDWKGKNMVVSRNPELSRIIREAAENSRISIDPMTAKEAAAAQAGGFRQRREGLTYRLRKGRARGEWVPTKRDLPDMTQPGFLRSRIYDLRAAVSIRSRAAFRKALDAEDIEIYHAEMRGVFKRLRYVELAAASFRILSIRARAMLTRLRP